MAATILPQCGLWAIVKMYLLKGSMYHQSIDLGPKRIKWERFSALSKYHIWLHGPFELGTSPYVASESRYAGAFEPSLS